MLIALLMQIVTLLPPAPTEPVQADLLYAKSVQTLAATDVWTTAALQQLSADCTEKRSALAKLIADGSDREVRLAAVLSAGAASDSALGRALWRRAALDFNEARCLASLLAPATPTADALPILAWIARDQRRSLPVRAAAVARLLDADCLAAWPTCRSMLLTGTATDATTDLANWPRKGRYELPKRILLLSLQELLLRHQLDPTDFEPNAAWEVQVQQVAKLDEVIASCSVLPTESEPPTTWQALLQLKKAGSDQAAASFLLFRHRAVRFLGKL